MSLRWCLQVRVSVWEFQFASRDFISVIEFSVFAACGCPSVKGDFCHRKCASDWPAWRCRPHAAIKKANGGGTTIICAEWEYCYSLMDFKAFSDTPNKNDAKTSPVFQKIQSAPSLRIHQKLIHSSDPNPTDTRSFWRGEQGRTSSPLFQIIA